ncbi:prokaryotic transglycosylase active site [Lucifera butyrica]|uniref:Prokaryotic transglycosylase active site n=1 Tax=Lucifera butyrica TaxID=1351585 RepID=A0A498RB88_9FIRM|nr:prokaryotic transglycosylase active site [Lucifera butyrica]
MRSTAWMKILVVGLTLAVAGSYFVYNSDWFQKKYVYPFPYQDMVFRYALKNEVDPFLVASIIRTESKFIPQARSRKGAMGLMQLMPDTAAWIAQRMDEPNFDPKQLQDPEVNIRLGTWYLSSLIKEFQGNEVLSLAAYNGGRGNVRQWMRQNGWEMSFQDARQLPFPETREYVRKVLRDRARYRSLYGR